MIRCQLFIHEKVFFCEFASYTACLNWLSRQGIEHKLHTIQDTNSMIYLWVKGDKIIPIQIIELGFTHETHLIEDEINKI